MIYLINLKTYLKGTGANAMHLANIIAELREETNADIFPVVQSVDISETSKIVPVFSQHIDPISYGAQTGRILPQAVRSAGAIGTLINHSERRLPLDAIRAAVSLAKQCGLKTVCCVANIHEVMAVAKFGPDYMAFEDPELIGTGRSVSKTKPELVSRFVEVLGEIAPSVCPLCGAGITCRDDVVAAKELGAKGVLVASAVVNATDQREALRNLIL